MGERKFCYRCMEKYDMEQHICPHCGYDDDSPHNPMYIIPGTVLHDRYMVGILLSYNGEGATYIAHDISTDCKVLLREYMPINFCTRVRNKATISVNYNNLAKYKAFMAEYTELNKSLARLRNNSNINPVLDMFAENNTTYTVFEYIDGEKILDFLKDNAGELSWEQVSKLFPPLFTTIGILHNSGIIHRAISPDTIYITAKGELKLSGFCVSAVRTADAGLEYELFKGYAAPEQYSASSSSRQGSWTDVYGVCALLYRALTGCMPIDSQSRVKNDDLCEPAMLNRNIPPHVSKAIMDGLNLSGKDRIQTITELVTRLFEQPTAIKPIVPKKYNRVENTPSLERTMNYRQPIQQEQYYQPPPPPPPPQQNYYQPENNNNNYDDYHYEKVSTVDRLKVPVIIGILLLAILLIISVFLMKIFVPASEESSSSRSSSSSLSENIVTDDQQSADNSEANPDTVVPKLVDSFYSYIADKYADDFSFEVTYEYHNDIEADRIIEQDIESGTMVAKGSTIHLVVNKGKEGGDIPSYDGRSVAQYENDLKEAGIVNYSLVRSSNSWGYPDTIVQLQVGGTEVKAGTYFSNKDNKKLLVYYIPEDAEVQAPQTQYTDYSGTTVTYATANTTGVSNSTTAAVVTTAVQRTDPPVTNPPVTDPPRTDPPVTNPPVTDPPQVITDPPQVVTDPPPVVTDPPPVVEPDPPEGGEVGVW